MNNTYNTDQDSIDYIICRCCINKIRINNLKKSIDKLNKIEDECIKLYSQFKNGSTYYYDVNKKIIWEFDRYGTGLLFVVNNDKIYTILMELNNLEYKTFSSIVETNIDVFIN